MAKQPPVREINWDAATRAVKDVAAAQNVPTTVFPKAAEPEDEPAVKPAQSDALVGVAPTSAKSAKTPSPSPSPTRMLSCVLPVYLIEEIQSRTFHSRPRQTTNYTVLMAFKDAGYHVKPEDLVPDRRRGRGRRA